MFPIFVSSSSIINTILAFLVVWIDIMRTWNWLKNLLVFHMFKKIQMRSLGFVYIYPHRLGGVSGTADVPYRDQALCLHGNVAWAKGLSFGTVPPVEYRNSFSKRKHQMHHIIAAFFSQKNKNHWRQLKKIQVNISKANVYVDIGFWNITHLIK